MRNKKYLFAIWLFLLVAGCSNEIVEEPPEAIVKINDENVETSRGTFEWETKGLFSNNAVIGDAAAPFQIAEEMEAQIVEKSSVATIEFSDGSEPQIYAYLWAGEERGEELPLKQHDLSLPEEKGRYVIEIEAEWPNGSSSYTFVVEVQ